MNPIPSTFPDLAGKVVVVTGASRGIGEAVALGFAAAGSRLVLASRKIEGVSAVAEKIQRQGGEALAVACHTGRAVNLVALAAELVAEESRRDKTPALQQGMMQDWLTGRTRLA